MNRFLRLAGYVLLPLSIAVSSCGSSDGFMTKGEFCSRVATPTCNRAIACGIAASSQQSYCVSEFQTGCCQDDGSCGEKVTNQQDETALETIITDCSAAMATFDCTMLAAGDAPVACGGTSTSYVAARLPSLQPGAAVASPRQLGALARKRLPPR
jgi:hypothetical protein